MLARSAKYSLHLCIAFKLVLRIFIYYLFYSCISFPLSFCGFALISLQIFDYEVDAPKIYSSYHLRIHTDIQNELRVQNTEAHYISLKAVAIYNLNELLN